MSKRNPCPGVMGHTYLKYLPQINKIFPSLAFLKQIHFFINLGGFISKFENL